MSDRWIHLEVEGRVKWSAFPADMVKVWQSMSPENVGPPPLDLPEPVSGTILSVTEHLAAEQMYRRTLWRI